MSDKLIKAREVADRLGCHIKTVYRRAKKGKLPPDIRFPDGSLQWMPEDIEPWLRDQKETEIVFPMAMSGSETGALPFLFGDKKLT